MVEKGQLELLKYKLQKNEFIKIQQSLKSLFKMIGSNPSTSSISIEIIEMIMNKKEYREIINYEKLLKEILIINNNEILELILNKYCEEYNKPNWISIKHLQYSIEHCSHRIINNLLKFIDNNNNTINENFRNNSIKWSLFNNNNYIDGSVTDFILNNNQLFNYTKIYLDIPYEFTSGKVYILTKLMELDFFKNTSNIKDFCSSTIIPLLYKQKFNVEIILFYFKLYFKCTISTIKIPPEIKQQIDDVLEGNKEIFTNFEKEKELFRLLIKTTKSKKLYSLFYFTYYELIDCMDNNCFKLLKTNQIIINLNKMVNKNEAIEFLTCFFKEITWKNWMKNLILADHISNIIFNKFECFDELCDNIGKQKLKFFINHYSNNPIKKVDSNIVSFKKSIIEHDINKINSLIDSIEIEKFTVHWNKSMKINDKLFKSNKLILIPNIMLEKIKVNLNFWIEKIKTKSMMVPLCKTIINYLYKKMILVKDITIKQIKEIKHLCDSASIKLEHSTFHSFLYLNIKSKKIIKYILSFNKLYGKEKGGCSCCPCKGDYKNKYVINNEKVIDNLIEPNVLTFEFIFGSSNLVSKGKTFEDLFEHFSNLYPNSIEFKNNQLNYLLEIDRVDLFIGILEEMVSNPSILKKGYLEGGLELKFVKQLIRSRSYDEITILLKRFIDIFKTINSLKGYHHLMLSMVMKCNREDLTTFIINEYNINYLVDLNLSWYNYPIIEYLFKNHSNMTIKIFGNVKGFKNPSRFIPFLKLVINYNRISELDIPHVIHIATKNNHTILLKILSENGLLNKLN